MKQTKANELLTIWINEKLDILNSILASIKKLVSDEVIEEKIERLKVRGSICNFGDESEPFLVSFDAYLDLINQIARERDAVVSDFLRTGRLESFVPPFYPQCDFELSCKVIKKECESLVTILKDCQMVVTGNFREFVGNINYAVFTITKSFYVELGRKGLQDFHLTRTERSTHVKRLKRLSDKGAVWKTYLDILRSFNDERTKAALTENWTANEICRRLNPNKNVEQTSVSKKRLG